VARPGSARRCEQLYQVLYEARRVLDPFVPIPITTYSSTKKSSACAQISPRCVDAEAFKAAANRAFRTQDQASLPGCPGRLSGDLLPDDIYEDWSNAVREALHQDHRHLLIGLAKLLENQKEYLPAIETLKQALISDALDEEANAGLMRLYVRTGQRQLALRQYQLFEEILQRELEVSTRPI